MFGVLLSNVLIKRYVADNLIQIDGFDPRLLQTAQYPLKVKSFLSLVEPASLGPLGKAKARFNPHIPSAEDFRFKPNQYLVAVVKERVVLAEGIVGRFIPSSVCIEKGFGLTLGKLDPGYGRNGEELRFGMHNLCTWDNLFDLRTPVAHIEFFDMRGMVDRVELTQHDAEIRALRQPTPPDSHDGPGS